MQFLKDHTRVKLAVVKMRAAGKGEVRTVNIEFGLMLDADIVKGMPETIREAYRQIRSPKTDVESLEFESSIMSQNVTFFRLPGKTAEIDFDADNVDIRNLRLDRVGGKEVALHFKMEFPMTKACWHWVWYAFQREIFAEFVECQTELAIKDESAAVN